MRLVDLLSGDPLLGPHDPCALLAHARGEFFCDPEITDGGESIG